MCWENIKNSPICWCSSENLQLYQNVLNIVLYCTVLYCIVLYCTILYSIVLYCTILHNPCKPWFTLIKRLNLGSNRAYMWLGRIVIIIYAHINSRLYEYITLLPSILWLSLSSTLRTACIVFLPLYNYTSFTKTTFLNRRWNVMLHLYWHIWFCCKSGKISKHLKHSQQKTSWCT